MSKPAAANDEDALLRAMMESAAMDETLGYLRRGRAHGELPDEVLKDAWTSAFKRWFADRGGQEERERDDLTAELRLRKLDPPFERIVGESQTMAEEVERRGANSEEVGGKIKKFRDDLRHRKN